VTGDWRKVHNEELHDVCCSPVILGYQLNEDWGGGGHVARTRETEIHAGSWWGNLKERATWKT
jgi:hypothetical protein